MDYKNIDKEIYHLPEISKHLKPMLWGWICLALGAVSGYFYFTAKTLGIGLSSLLLGLLIIGVFALATLLCYYSFGDSRAPFHKPTKKLLEREYAFYPASEREALCEALEKHDYAALKGIKKGSAPQLVVVRYSDEAESIAYSQVQEMHGDRKKPLTDIVFDETK